MNKTHFIEHGTLVVLSGLQGAGKSRLRTLAKNLPANAWISADEVRKSVLGAMPVLCEGRLQLNVRQDANEAVHLIMQTTVATRIRNGLTTVVDMTAPNDAERKCWVDIAEQHGAPHLVVIVDTPLEQCLENMALREDWVPEHRIRETANPAVPEPSPAQSALAKRKGKAVVMTAPEGFVKTSQYKHIVVPSNFQLEFGPRQLSSDKVDIVGDVHGLLDDLLLLLEAAGWNLVDGHLRHADPERRLLFLGDLVDRGPQSIEVLELVKRAVEDGIATCILGNHEDKLVRFVETAEREGIEKWGSYANAETGMKLFALPEAKRNELVRFMKFLPSFVTYEPAKIAFVHADVHRFDPTLSLKGDLVYGQSGYKRGEDSDRRYEEGFSAGLNEYLVIRGHIPQTSEQAHILSLERHGFQKGELMLMPLDQFLREVRNGMSTTAALKTTVLTQKCDFDYEAYSAERFKLIRAMEQLVSSKLARKYFDPSKMLRGYKYTKEVFWKGSWSESEWLLKARGIILDPSGAIVSHPFDKVFNFAERGTGMDLPDDTPVVDVEKLNGFLGIISPHPVRRGELLVHTQGSQDEDQEFTQYILELLTPKNRGLLCKFFANRPLTLMFEVIHPSDPHIIEYREDMHGLHLIGARGLNLNDIELTEEEVDDIGIQVEMRRPAWRRTTWGAVKAAARESRGEGSMVRHDTAGQEFILKLKSPYYLTTKFLGRMSDKKVKHMYGNASDFKKHVDEEMYPIVDAVTARFTQAQFLAMTDEQRVPLVRQLVAELQ